MLGRNMDSVAVAPWDGGRMRAICSGFGQVLDAEGKVILRLGPELVPHGQEVRVGHVRDNFPGPEMVLRWNGHRPEVYVVGSSAGKIVSRLKLNPSPTNVGMEVVYFSGRDRPGLLFNGGWLWDLQQGQGLPLPGLPPPRGGQVHRMGFYHAIPADICGDRREELVVWDPTAASVFIHTPAPQDEDGYEPCVGHLKIKMSFSSPACLTSPINRFCNLRFRRMSRRACRMLRRSASCRTSSRWSLIRLASSHAWACVMPSLA